MDARRRACLRTLGVDIWVPRLDRDGRAEGEFVSHSGGEDATGGGPGSTVSSFLEPRSSNLPSPALGPRPSAPEFRPVALDSEPNLDWPELQETVEDCKACALYKTRTQAVFGVGAKNADLMVIGEAPGADEDRQGEPFVGRAGRLLNAMLEAIGLAREQVYIANIIKCRPPGNRDPHIEEAAACQSYLHQQIALIRPRLILSVGRVSAHNLLGTDESVGRLRGRVHRFDPGDIRLVVTYHPAYLLRRPQEKSKAWQDMQAVYRELHQA